MNKFALHIIAGPGLGREYILEPGREAIIGRVETSDWPIIDDNISRRHVAITATENSVQARDLDSRNGTFLNAQRITNATLKPGDEITVGRCRLKLLLLPSASTPPATQPPKQLVQTPPPPSPAKQTVELPAIVAKPLVPASSPGPSPAVLRPTEVTEGFRGSLSEIRLESVLQLLSSTRKRGMLVLRSGNATGRIFLQEGRVYYACMEEWLDVDPRKVFFRLLRWYTGTFELEKSDVRVFANPIIDSTDALLLEGLHQLDELTHLSATLPPLEATVALVTPLPLRLSEMEKRDLDFLQLVIEMGTVQRILDHFPGTDFEGYTYLQGMVTRNLLKISPPQTQAKSAESEQQYRTPSA